MSKHGWHLCRYVTAINYNNEVAWIGMVLVNRNHRSKGISKMLLSALFEQLHSCKSIKLDATPAGQPVYQKFGFKDEYLIHRMTAIPVSAKGPRGFGGEQLPQAVHFNDSPEIVEYDKRVFGADRKQLIEFLIKDYPDNALILKRDGQISGLALGRKGTRFHQIGPVMAPTTEDAKKLIIASLEKLEGQPVVIDVLDDKQDLIDWLVEAGFTKKRHFVRMYQNENPYPGMRENHYLIGGPEFG